ncbi:MAG: hypothetical protein NPIRA01_16670 [Nitrospirales bacterium]|nr:MAG: hypothetical protein NPIRA01_16670 [Nitrospirales bacterium]
MHAYETPSEIQQGLTRYFAFYNTHRPHQVHAGQTPDMAYFSQLAVAKVA